MQLKDKAAIVTGAASGFGEAIARRYAAEGANVVCADLNDQLGRKVADEIGGAYVHADVADRDDVKAMVRTAVDRYGRLDTMVNNAGITHVNRPMLEVGEEEFDRIFAVNVKAIYLAALEIVPLMREQGGGCIINTASTAGLRPRPGLTWYNASKGAAITMTKSMAAELGPDNIRVNALCPVAGDTPLLSSFLGANPREAFEATVPLGRLCTSEDVAKAALWLASDEASFITGVAFPVDGGRGV
ncbi:MAG: glucose 1-dehydrogenase [Rhodospirillaceae bacterium]|nr:glucose 1-dehydrogenase [Rhodospirillaceae bacterium]MYH39332.1 glucose 1-dehydrogenase [Rhodospirillaceae bacterium]MYK13956.1 glucose 1-dehydrogenase [Rhodospirillaceae bacterium]MYK58706.1 glucose 1-dehydrogenase [Rhodospirillaceae bacterium]